MKDLFSLYKVYTDVESGTTEKREGLISLINDIESNKFDMIVSKELSRLARNGSLSYKIRDLTLLHNIHIVTLDSVLDTRDPAKRGLFGVYVWLYEQESQRTSERIKMAYKAKYKNGEFLGSLPPYGYYLENKKLYVRDDISPEIVQLIYSKYISGWGTERIAKHLTSLSLPTPSILSGKSDAGSLWHGSTISKILANRVYIGELVFHKETTTSVVLKKRQPIPEEEQVVVEGTHEAIIEYSVWKKAQDIRLSRRRNHAISKGEKHLFTGILECADCGSGFHYRANRIGYICGRHGKHGKEECSSHLIKEEYLIDIILSDIRKLAKNINTDNILKKVTSNYESVNKKARKELNKMTVKKDTLISRRGNFITLLADNSISKKDFDIAMTLNADELSIIENKIDALKASIQEKPSTEHFEQLRIKLESILKFDSLTKDTLTQIVEKIQVTEKGEPVIYYKFAPAFNAVI